MTDATYDGQRIVLPNSGRTIAANYEEADHIIKAIMNWKVARTLARQEEQRRTGQVWKIQYLRFGSFSEEIEYTLQDAIDTLWWGAEDGNLTYNDPECYILCPDGTKYAGEELYRFLKENHHD